MTLSLSFPLLQSTSALPMLPSDQQHKQQLPLVNKMNFLLKLLTEASKDL